MTKRSAVIAVAALAALVAGGIISILLVSAEPSETGVTVPSVPNVLIVVTDDQRAGTLDAMPATARLFKTQGVNFRNALVTTPLCCPSRATIMTGRYVHNHKVKRFIPEELDQTTTLQRYLSDVGYRNAFFGKYLNAWDLHEDPPYFDDWAIFPQSTRKTYGSGGLWNVSGDIRTIESYSTDFIGARSEAFLRGGERDDARPWLMFVSVPAAHPPFVVERRYADAPVSRWRPDPAVGFHKSGKPPYLRKRVTKRCDLGCARDIRAAQYRTLYSVDEMIARLFDTIGRLNESRHTLAFLVSDNGLLWGEFGLTGKRYPYRASVEVPLLMRWPARLSPMVDRRLVTNVDIAPTIFDALDIQVDAGDEVDGRSLLSRSWTRRRILLEHWTGPRAGHIPSWASYRSRRVQYIEYYTGGRERRGWRELYALKRDPWQLRNLLARPAEKAPSPRRVRWLHRALRQLRHCEGRSCP
jgi:arylsulfatase A-like enzyme